MLCSWSTSSGSVIAARSTGEHLERHRMPSHALEVRVQLVPQGNDPCDGVIAARVRIRLGSGRLLLDRVRYVDEQTRRFDHAAHT
jgi:hypothetical protein